MQKISYAKYFPNATRIEYPAYSNFVEKVATIGGHNSAKCSLEIQGLEKSFLIDHSVNTNLPSGFKLLN